MAGRRVRVGSPAGRWAVDGRGSGGGRAGDQFTLGYARISHVMLSSEAREDVRGVSLLLACSNWEGFSRGGRM